MYKKHLNNLLFFITTMKSYRITQFYIICIIFLNLLQVNSLMNISLYKFTHFHIGNAKSNRYNRFISPPFQGTLNEDWSKNKKYNKLILKDTSLQDDSCISNECIVNVGNAIDVLQRELPFLFVLENISFNIFSSHIMVVTNKNKINIPKYIYISSIKTLQKIASFSRNQPKINVRKIDYIEDTKTIQCLVEVVLPKIINTYEEQKWEGYFYFGVDENGLIKTHIFDRKISNLDVECSNLKLPRPFDCSGKYCLHFYNKYNGFLKLMRVKSIPPTFLLCFSGGWIMNPSLQHLIKSVPFMVSTINTLLIMTSSMVINDIYDIEVDRINSPHRPLVNGEITIKEAYLLSLVLLGLSEYLTFKFLPFNLQMIVQLTIIKIILYTPVLKRIFLIKNISCAGLVSFSIFFNGLASVGNTLLTTNPNFGLLGIALSFIFFGSWSNELILDIRDIEGDKNNKIVTIPTLFGKEYSWLLIYIINNYNIVSNSLSIAYLYNSPGIGSVIVVILSPLLVNLFKVKQEKYSLESLKNYTQKSNYPLLVLLCYLCGLAYFNRPFYLKNM